VITQLPPYWFNLSCDTQRIATTFDSGGGPVNTWSTNLSGVPMRMNIPSGNQQAQQERINGVLVTKFYVNGNPSPDIISDDRIIYNGNAYDIKAVRDFDQSGIYLTIDAVLVQPAAAVT
jgi:hypothetical protein